MDAYLLRIGFEAGLYTRADVREWVDRQLQVRASLSAALLELTTIASADDVEVARYLRQLEQTPDGRTQLECELAVLAEQCRRRQLSLDDALHKLLSLHGREELREEEANALADLEVGLALAAEGGGTMDEVRSRVAEFLAQYPLP